MFKQKRGRKPKYTHVITLRNVNAKELQKKLKGDSEGSGTAKLPIISPIIEYSTTFNTFSSSIPTNSETTNLTDTSELRQHYWDNSNTITNTTKGILMKDHVDFGCLPNRTDLCCWHDHHTFTTSPIGIPIKYIPKKPDTTTSDATGTNDYFLTVGVFCSFPCCLAFIAEHGNDVLLRNSEPLLYMLYNKLYSTEMRANPAPSWKHLKEYGGNVNSIDEFRKSFCNNYNYVITNNIKRPFMVAVGNYTEQQKCF